MLRELRLSAFKCFSELALPLRPLTLLAGVNGSGKSTVLQGLVLLHQALLDTGTDGAQLTNLPLNGSLLTLGSVRDVVDKTKGGKSFGLGLSSTGAHVSWEFRGDNPLNDLAAIIAKTTWKLENLKKLSGKRQRGLLPKQLMATTEGKELFRTLAKAQYVPADRLGPSEAFPLLAPDRHKTLGPRAERAVGALYWKRDDDVSVEGLRHPDRRHAPRVVRQVEAWLNELFPGVVMDVQRVLNANLATLGIGIGGTPDFHRPQHVGFGMTYALPILVALLSAAPGDLVLLENPEAHLHPRAQVSIAGLCVRAARCGIQVILETHSDHVLNGIRVAVHRAKLSPEQVGIHFFERRSLEGNPSWRTLGLGPGGRLTERPAGFFDEIERQLTELLEPSDGDA